MIMAKISVIIVEVLVLITIFELEKVQSISLEKLKENNNEKVAVKIDSPIERYRIVYAMFSFLLNCTI